MTLKFYLHAAPSPITGLSTTTRNTQITTPDVVATTNFLLMDEKIGSLQTSTVGTTLADAVTSQSMLIQRFTSPPLKPFTPTLAWNAWLRVGNAESNLNCNFRLSAVLSIVRPSTDATVGVMWHSGFFTGAEPLAAGAEEDSTEQNANGPGYTSTTAWGDVLLLEVWRQAATQAMATAYTNTVFYDGTTEGSATTNAAYIRFDNDIPIIGQTMPKTRARYRAATI